MALVRAIKIAYYYEVPNKKGYTLEFVDTKKNLIEANLKNLTLEEVEATLDSIRFRTHKVYSAATSGLKVHNKKPPHKLLTAEADDLLRIYTRNLLELKESENPEYGVKHRVAKLLKSVADFLDDEEEKNQKPVQPGEIENFINSELEKDSTTPEKILPQRAVDPFVPMEVVDFLQQKLDVNLNFSDLTFWFQDRRFQLTKEGYEQPNLPKFKRPGTSTVVNNVMQHMCNLMGTVAEFDFNLGQSSFRFMFNFEAYTISHIYTGDYNSLPGVNQDMTAL